MHQWCNISLRERVATLKPRQSLHPLSCPVSCKQRRNRQRFWEAMNISLSRMGDNKKQLQSFPGLFWFGWGFEFKKQGVAFFFCVCWGRFEPSHHVFKMMAVNLFSHPPDLRFLPKDKAMRLEQLLEAATAREATMERPRRSDFLVPKTGKQMSWCFDMYWCLRHDIFMCVSNASSHPKLVVICRGCLFLRAESAAQAAGAMGGSQQPMARSYTCLDACMPLSYTYIYIYHTHGSVQLFSWPGPLQPSTGNQVNQQIRYGGNHPLLYFFVGTIFRMSNPSCWVIERSIMADEFSLIHSSMWYCWWPKSQTTSWGWQFIPLFTSWNSTIPGDHRISEPSWIFRFQDETEELVSGLSQQLDSRETQGRTGGNPGTGDQYRELASKLPHTYWKGIPGKYPWHVPWRGIPQ